MAYQQKFRLDGELAVITGGGRAIGLCCAEALAEAGARVVVIERSETDAAQAIALRKKGHDVQLRLGDVTDRPEWKKSQQSSNRTAGRPPSW